MIFAGASRACLGKDISEQTQCHYIYGSIYIEICVCVSVLPDKTLFCRSLVVHLFICFCVCVSACVPCEGSTKQQDRELVSDFVDFSVVPVATEKDERQMRVE